MTANETQRAVASLRAKLPEPWRPTPRLVHTIGEALDGVGFCRNHDGPAEYACGGCWVIDVHEPQLAALIVALLRAAPSLAAHLNGVDAWGHAVRKPEQDGGDWSCGRCGDLGQMPEQCPAWSAADIAHAINKAATW